MKYDFYVRSREDLIEAIRVYGIVPYFSNIVPGFSLEEHCDPRVLWSDTGDDAWAWKGPVIRAAHCAYGKLILRKAAYVSEEVYLDLANLRRDGYDFDARYEDGLARHDDKALYDLIDANAPVLSTELRRSGGYAYRGRYRTVEGRKGFEPSVTRLQAQCYVLVSDFVYPPDKYGRPTGWGVAMYNTPEKWFGERFTERVYTKTPEESRERLTELLRGCFPSEDEKTLQRLLR